MCVFARVCLHALRYACVCARASMREGARTCEREWRCDLFSLSTSDLYIVHLVLSPFQRACYGNCIAVAAQRIFVQPSRGATRALHGGLVAGFIAGREALLKGCNQLAHTSIGCQWRTNRRGPNVYGPVLGWPMFAICLLVCLSPPWCAGPPRSRVQGGTAVSMHDDVRCARAYVVAKLPPRDTPLCRIDKPMFVLFFESTPNVFY
jgi:hypothetical protein